MKKDLHPSTYRPVVFQDLNNKQTFLTRSTVATDDKITLDGKFKARAAAGVAAKERRAAAAKKVSSRSAEKAKKHVEKAASTKPASK
jgi:hypothetical protein